MYYALYTCDSRTIILRNNSILILVHGFLWWHHIDVGFDAKPLWWKREKKKKLYSAASTEARIHKGGLSTNLGFRTSYDAFYAFFTNVVCKEQKEVWRNKRRFELKPWSELKPCFVNSGLYVPDYWVHVIYVYILGLLSSSNIQFGKWTFKKYE